MGKAMNPFSPVSVCAVGTMLGEGPVWIDGALWFVDIKGELIHRFDPVSGEQRSWPAPHAPGWILPCDDGGLLAGLQNGLYRFDPADGSFTPYVAIPGEPATNRLNDATVDQQGRLWFGTMDNGERAATGRVFRLADGCIVRTPITAVGITNGPAVSPDGRTLYHVDTLGGIVTAYDIADDATLSDPREFVRIDPADGHPDGPTVDSEGFVWVALYGGWAVRRYAPDGTLVATVRFPVANITKIAFGGSDLRTAFATTARWLLAPDALDAQPLAGNVFAFDPGVAGLHVPPLAMGMAADDDAPRLDSAGHRLATDGTQPNVERADAFGKPPRIG